MVNMKRTSKNESDKEMTLEKKGECKIYMKIKNLSDPIG